MEKSIDIDLMDSPIKDNKAATRETAAAILAPVAEYEEDVIDYDDDELVPATHNSGDDTLIGTDDEDIKLEDESTEAEAKTISMAEEQAENAQVIQEAAGLRLEQAKYAMSLGPQTLLSSSPDMATALQLNDIGDTAAVNVSVNGVTYEITWKVAGFLGEDSPPTIELPATDLTVDTQPRKNSLRDAPPLSIAHSTPKCKFGRNCNKGTSCAFDHTVKPRLCTWVNKAQGCTKSEGCEFSHDNEGVRCTRSTTRFNCANGNGCAFKHGDDVSIAREVKTVAAPVKHVKTATPHNAPTGPKGANTTITPPPPTVPAGPKINGGANQFANVAGQKRSRDQDDDGGNVTQYKRVNNNTGNFNDGSVHRGGKQYRGRGRGNGRGRGWGRGSVAAGGELRIRGAATGGQ